jgi:multimeric flavodoxin WrbA
MTNSRSLYFLFNNSIVVKFGNIVADNFNIHENQGECNMKIVCLLGSPRPNGNSTTIARCLLDEAGKLGAEVSIHSLNRLKFRGCQACMACKGKLDHCALNDDLTPVLEEIRLADILVLATPVYFADVSSQMKMLLDRIYSFYVTDFMTNPKPSRLNPGKRLIFIQTQAQPEESMFNDIYSKYEFFFQVLGFRDNRLIRALGVSQPDDAANREDIMELTTKTAKEVVLGDCGS